nr:hypothetical protein [Mobilicoccus caccae]
MIGVVADAVALTVGVCATGVLAAADAVFVTAPASISVWVSVCVPVHPVVAPGASLASPQLARSIPNAASDTTGEVRVVAPVFSSVNV